MKYEGSTREYEGSAREYEKYGNLAFPSLATGIKYKLSFKETDFPKVVSGGYFE